MNKRDIDYWKDEILINQFGDEDEEEFGTVQEEEE